MTQQTVRVWSLPQRVEPSPFPEDNGLPSVLSLTRGDVILSINGRQILDEDDCRREIRNSPRTMEFTVRDSRDGTVWRMQSMLRDTSPRFGTYLDDAGQGPW